MERIKIDQIKPNGRQPRKYFTGIDELAASIKQKGLLEPIMVRPLDDHYEIVHGHRRWLAAQKAGLDEIDVIVREATDQEAFEMALIENVQRENLTPMEEAGAFEEMQAQGYTQQAIADIIGKGQSYVAHKLRLLKLPGPITFYLQRGALTENHIRQIAKLRDIYGADLPRGLPPQAGETDKEYLEEVKNEIDAALLLLFIRPEERLIYCAATQLMVEACRCFRDYVLKHNCAVKQWEVAGFWWASLAVSFDLTVADLTLGIERWRERYEDGRIQWYFYKQMGVPKDKKEARVYWGLFADMRHSASLNADNDIYNQSSEAQAAFERRLRLLAKRGSWVLPSEMQQEAQIYAAMELENRPNKPSVKSEAKTNLVTRCN